MNKKTYGKFIKYICVYYWKFHFIKVSFKRDISFLLLYITIIFKYHLNYVNRKLCQ